MRISIIALVMCVVACGDDSNNADPYKCVAAGGDACFEYPTARVEAADPISFASKAPDLTSCPAMYEIQTIPSITFTGHTFTLFGNNAIAAARFEIFQNLNLTGSLADVTSDDGTTDPDLTGSYTVTVDNMPSQVFLRTSKSGFLPLVFLYQRFDPAATALDPYDAKLATRTDISMLFENVSDAFIMGKTQVIGHATDCNGNNLVNVVANVSTSSAIGSPRTYEVGVRTYYAEEGLELRLARRTMMMQTGTSGRFAASNLSAGRHFIQIWGYLTDADVAMGGKGLSLLGEQEIIATSIESAQIVPLYGHEP